MKCVLVLQKWLNNMSAFVRDAVQVPHCYSAELVIWRRRNLVSVQCVTAAAFLPRPVLSFQ